MLINYCSSSKNITTCLGLGYYINRGLEARRNFKAIQLAFKNIIPVIKGDHILPAIINPY